MTQRHRIAIVDDDDSVARALSRLVRSAGYEVESYGSAEEFLLLADPHSLDCLIVDINLPSMSGLTLQDHLLAQGLGLSVIVMTVAADPAQLNEAMKKGAHAFFRKPIEHRVLLAALRGILEPLGARCVSSRTPA